MLRGGRKLYVVYSMADGESPKIGGQKVMEPKWSFRITNYMAMGSFPGSRKWVEASSHVQTLRVALGISLVTGRGRTC